MADDEIDYSKPVPERDRTNTSVAGIQFSEVCAECGSTFGMHTAIWSCPVGGTKFVSTFRQEEAALLILAGTIAGM